jgi:hypothetical protein
VGVRVGSDTWSFPQIPFVQTNINNLIVAVQDVTADPKTDDRLGKVGIYINK